MGRTSTDLLRGSSTGDLHRETVNAPVGMYGFRRFRLTWLRKNRVPGDVERFWMGHDDQEKPVPRDLERSWMGHADEEVGDLYSKVEEEAEFCLKIADSVGLGFTLPPEKKIQTCEVAPIVEPIAPKIAVQEETV